MSEQFQRQIVLKMQDGMTRGDGHLCGSCAAALVRRGANSAQDVQICGTIGNMTGGRRGVIVGRVSSCSHYYPTNLPQLYQLEAIAWEIVTKGNRGQIGFITPEDRRNAGINQSAPAPTRW